MRKSVAGGHKRTGSTRAPPWWLVLTKPGADRCTFQDVFSRLCKLLACSVYAEQRECGQEVTSNTKNGPNFPFRSHRDIQCQNPNLVIPLIIIFNPRSWRVEEEAHADGFFSFVSSLCRLQRHSRRNVVVFCCTCFEVKSFQTELLGARRCETILFARPRSRPDGQA